MVVVFNHDDFIGCTVATCSAPRGRSIRSAIRGNSVRSVIGGRAVCHVIGAAVVERPC